jgi:hypothetical protein
VQHRLNRKFPAEMDFAHDWSPAAAAEAGYRAGTTAHNGRKMTLHHHDSVLIAARRHAETLEFQSAYRQHRPMVERSIAWIVRGNRKLRYRGTAKNDSWLHHRVAAINLRRLIVLGLTHTGTTWAVA